MATTQIEGSKAVIRSEPGEGGVLTVTLEGSLDSRTTGRVWREAVHILEKQRANALVVETSKIHYCDGSGIGLLFDLKRRQQDRGGTFEIRGFRKEFARMLALFDTDDFKGDAGGVRRHRGLFVEIGRISVKTSRDIVDLFVFLGEIFIALGNVVLHPSKLRWKELFYIAETAGVNALPIVALVSFLMGLVMAFQSAITLKMFGVEIFIANLVVLSMFRELGPLMTAIILAGRSGSAFAAELGTMKVNEEIAALTTMGLEPVRFLVLSRVLATVAISPILTVFANLFGLLGGCVVMLSLGFPLVTFVNQIVSAADYVDLLSGLAKSLVFGLIVAGVGCGMGLRTKIGARAVGVSATRAVVYGIVLIIVADGMFSVAYYYLGI